MEEAALGHCWGPARDLRTQLVDTVKFITSRCCGDVVRGVVRTALNEDFDILIRKGEGLGLPVVERIRTARNAAEVTTDDLRALCIWSHEDWSIYDKERIAS